MELPSGVNKYLNELIDDESNYIVLIYGSYAMGRANESSDLDVFVCGDFGSCYRKAMVIENSELEINFVDIGLIHSKIDNSINSNNSYYASVFNNNIVLKDSYLLVDRYKRYVNNARKYTKKYNREMPQRNKYLISKFYKEMREYYDLYNYFNFLDEIRITSAYMYCHSSLNVGKVYEMYNDSEHAKCDYCLDMPDYKFIRHYDSAIRNPLSEKEIKWLMKSVDFDPCVLFRDCHFFKYCDKERIKSILIHMDKMVNKAIKFIVENNPYQDYVYYVVVNHLYRFYEEIYGSVTEEFESVFNSAKQESNNLLKIEFLKQLFSLLEGKYAFDYKNYTLYLN